MPLLLRVLRKVIRSIQQSFFCMVEFQSELIIELGKEDFDSSALSFLGHVNDHLFLPVRAVRHLEPYLVVGNKNRLYNPGVVTMVT